MDPALGCPKKGPSIGTEIPWVYHRILGELRVYQPPPLGFGHHQKPWIETLNRQTTDYDSNLELLRNQSLFRSSYTPTQDFHFLWNASFASVIPVEFEDELKQSRTKAVESLHAGLSWVDSLRGEELISEKTAAFYST